MRLREREGRGRDKIIMNLREELDSFIRMRIQNLDCELVSCTTKREVDDIAARLKEVRLLRLFVDERRKIQ